MFIGNPKSGHSLVGFLLNAHKNAVISHELNALAYFRMNPGRDAIYHLIMDRDRTFARNGYSWNGYSYGVPGQWQGKYESLKVIGDKKGGMSSRLLGRHPDLLSRVRQTVGVPVKLIHVVRNPYDNISAITKHDNISLKRAVNKYFSKCHAVADIMDKTCASEVFSLRHEDFIANPEEILGELCRFLGLPCYPGYIADCCRIVFDSPRKRRHTIHWTEPLRDDVRKRMRAFEFLRGYSFES